jgi:hypothetical protein
MLPRVPQGLWQQIRWPLTVYLATRAVLLVVVIVDSLWHGWSLTSEVTNWDGVWYDALAHYGYPHFAVETQTTLGFLPLYPMAMLGLSHISPLSNADSGLLISLVGGFIATLLVGQLARRWWDEAASRRVIVFFCVFPGSIVFSMAYSEGLLLPLAAGCLLAMEYRRWFLAGVLAACCTAISPVAVAIIPACAAAAARELYLRGRSDVDGRAVIGPVLRGLRDREGRRSLWAPLLAPLGLIAFGIYLWAWTGTPFASYNAQRVGWNEKSSPWAVINTFRRAISEFANWHNWHHPGINLNYDSGSLGTIFLLCALWLLWRQRHRVSAAAIGWTLWVALLTLTSWATPDNPRMLLCAFPALMVVAQRLRGRAFRWLIGCSTVLLIVMSALTYYGTSLRP